ncbi:hypothetical protein GCM10012286_83320 [Streptomyces lasiicapitis]|uniref:Uncharacterized protein n=2 Tax=Streptomyces lasiicapitis TaxID=1923961 RepID=A0ABQ2MYF7_9ACTN|nr:hypothetical protein GCM10012286_83320 [Streptomyces lasiicapitis]
MAGQEWEQRREEALDAVLQTVAALAERPGPPTAEEQRISAELRRTLEASIEERRLDGDVTASPLLESMQLLVHVGNVIDAVVDTADAEMDTEVLRALNAVAAMCAAYQEPVRAQEQGLPISRTVAAASHRSMGVLAYLRFELLPRLGGG